MIATFLTKPNTVHAVFRVWREGLKVKTQGYCGADGNAADGTFQVPEQAFDGRQLFLPHVLQGAPWQPCALCSAAVKRAHGAIAT